MSKEGRKGGEKNTKDVLLQFLIFSVIQRNNMNKINSLYVNYKLLSPVVQMSFNIKKKNTHTHN